MKKRDITLLLASGLILVIAWIIFSIYHKAATSTITPAVSIQIAPITPSFDTKTIDTLKARKSVSPLYDLGASLEKIATPSPTIRPQQTRVPPVATQSSQTGNVP